MKILLIIDYKSKVSIILIIPEDILFKHVMANNVQYRSDRKPFDHQWEGFPALIDLIGLITAADFN